MSAADAGHPVRNLTLPDEFYGLLPLDVVRRLRDQLTAHLDAVQ